LLGAFTLTNVYKTLKMSFDAASEKYDIRITVSTRFFPAPTSSRPESDRDVSDAAEKLEQLFYYKMDREDPVWSHFIFVLIGLRQAERLGLEVSSIVLDDGEPRLEIHQQLDFSQSRGGWYLKNTTKNG
jgi:hypothetical protein